VATKRHSANTARAAAAFNLTDDDVIEAMREIEGYLDISVKDFRDLYAKALQLARERFLRATPVGKIMQPLVAVIDHTAPFEKIIATLADASVSGLPVVDDTGRVIGVVSEKDIFNRLSGESDTSFWQVLSGCLHHNTCLMQSITAVSAKDIMTAPAITVEADISVRDALELCSKYTINRLPVVDGKGRIAGIVTRTDILQAHLDFEGE